MYKQSVSYQLQNIIGKYKDKRYFVVLKYGEYRRVKNSSLQTKVSRLQLQFQAEKVIYKKETIINDNDDKLPPQ